MDKFWLSRKFWYVMAAYATILALALTGTMQFTTEQIMDFLGVVVIAALGTHAATDITSLIVSRDGSSSSDS